MKNDVAFEHQSRTFVLRNHCISGRDGFAEALLLDCAPIRSPIRLPMQMEGSRRYINALRR